MSILTHGRAFLPLTLVAFLAVGCQDSITTAPIDAAAVNLDQVDPTEEGLPFHLNGDAVLAGQDFAPDFGPPEFGKSDFGGRCSVPSDFVIRFSITGQATHMGDVTASVEHCALVDFQTGHALSESDGEMVITAADGDELWARYQRIPGEAEGAEFIGGTGRFTGASGDASMQTQCDQSAGTCVLEMDGLLAYDASDPSQ